MSQIKILPETISNKIAAGEVIERPASVVKELIENALDADSDRILIEIENGGRRLIQIADNGVGMSRDDALLAIERYATSKIFSDKDLYSIHTLGFRGEALPSIAAVSHLTLTTREAASDEGVLIQMDGGRLKTVATVGAPVGTMITVKNLFYNTPARRKFLKTMATEMGHIADTVAHLAMGKPKVQFKLTHNGKTIKSWPRTEDPLTRVSAIVGQEIYSALYPIDCTTAAARVSGWIAAPHITRRTSQSLYFFVNDRFVKDPMIRHAVLAAYSGYLMKGNFPVAMLTIQIPFDRIDVNVHPTKHEVRFAEANQVHQTIVQAVKSGLQQNRRVSWTPQPQKSYPPPASEPPSLFEYTAGYKTNHGSDAVIESVSTRIQPPPDELAPRYLVSKPPVAADPVSLPAAHPTPPHPQQPLWQSGRFRDLRVIGQMHNTYILCETADGLMIMDQHAAHERILFEELRAQTNGNRQPVQKLLIPETIELDFRQADALEKMIPSLQTIGFEIEPFGGTTFVVKAAPAMLANQKIKPLIIEITEKMVSVGFTQTLQKAFDHCLTLIACHAALRAKQSLTDQQIYGLLNRIEACDNPDHCPHGRPIWVKYSTAALEKAFRRTL